MGGGPTCGGGGPRTNGGGRLVGGSEFIAGSLTEIKPNRQQEWFWSKKSRVSVAMWSLHLRV